MITASTQWMKISRVIIALMAVTATTLIATPASAQFGADDVIRLNHSEPIITRNMFPSNRRSDGDNINGPSMIRIPDWIPRSERANRNANYYQKPDLTLPDVAHAAKTLKWLSKSMHRDTGMAGATCPI